MKRLQLKQTDELYFLNKVREVESQTRIRESIVHIQHGDTSVFKHCLAVAYVSFLIIRILRLKVDLPSLIIGALLHDYFLYDWHNNPELKWHGYKHPRIALANAEAALPLNDTERNIIIRHMFPLTPTPPTCKESVVVCLADKICSTYEVFARDTYKWLSREYFEHFKENL